MRVLDLFSGIGGFSLGLERAGMTTVAFCEIEPYASSILSKHWPDVPNLGDVRTADFPDADLICGGFPCQDVSIAGRRAGLAGERSGLYRHLVRAIRLVRPKFAIVENVAALLSDGMGTVLGDLAESGYDTQWDCISAAHVGAPTIRDRIWILAQPMRARWEGCQQYFSASLAEAEASTLHGDAFTHARAAMAGDLTGLRIGDGFPVTLERARIAGLGNAVVPQIPEIIGRAILNAERAPRKGRPSFAERVLAAQGSDHRMPW